mmetsp:Transcript_48544/g.83396  ORF Transcript_48544/g.83396 Transcript_48544/m.83396 type:complete len:93 (-) Transcript_48544:270-548(-)
MMESSCFLKPRTFANNDIVFWPTKKIRRKNDEDNKFIFPTGHLAKCLSYLVLVVVMVMMMIFAFVVVCGWQQAASFLLPTHHLLLDNLLLMI